MLTDAQFVDKLWKALKSDRIMMLGVEGVDHDRTQPMTAMLEEGSHYIWFFTTKDNHLVEAMRQNNRVIATFSSKGHELFATIDGRLEEDNDRTTINKLWNPFAAAWFEGGKDDPNLQLIRLDPSSAQIWLNENSSFAGLKALLGRDPKKDYKDKVAEVAL